MASVDLPPRVSSTAFSSLHTSHNPSLAMIKCWWVGRISNYSISGMQETPTFFSSRSPKALVIASWPATLPFKIIPPYFLRYRLSTWSSPIRMGYLPCDLQKLSSMSHWWKPTQPWYLPDWQQSIVFCSDAVWGALNSRLIQSRWLLQAWVDHPPWWRHSSGVQICYPFPSDTISGRSKIKP